MATGKETPLHLTDVVCDEAKAFAARHPDLNAAQQATGMLTWGLLRALAECPDCPGVFRVSPDDWHTLVCPQCRGVWVYTPTPEAPVKAQRGKKRKGTP
jgi:hypothetical protein